MTKESKFSGILRTRQDAGPEPETSEPTTAKRGRPAGRGKRNNPNYAQVTAYISKKLHAETKVNLIRLGNREFSELISELLMEWNLKQSDRQ